MTHLTSTKDYHLEIKFNDKNQVYDKIAWRLGGGFLSFQVLSANTISFLPVPLIKTINNSYK